MMVMRRVGLALVGLLFGVLLAAPAAAQNTQNFTISSFEADYYLSRNQAKTSLLSVKEKIVAQFPDFDQNHGILRAIPQSYQDHTVNLQLVGVKKADGSAWPYSTYEQNDNLVLKIGDPDKFVHGQQTYLISYQLRNVINFQPGGDEFYWDINGDLWPQVMESVEARIHVPTAYLQGRQLCYAGYSGSRDQSLCRISSQPESSEDVITVRTNQQLGGYQTLTVAIGLEQGVFKPGPEIAREKLITKIKDGLSGIGMLAPGLVAFGLMFKRWRQFGDDPKGRGVIVPQYQPPKALDSLSSDYLLKGSLRSQAISAALIELATHKHIFIFERPKKGLFGKKDYELELQSLPAGIRPETKKLLQAIFETLEPGRRIKLSDLAQKSARVNLYSDLQDVEKDLAANLSQQGYFIKNPSKIRSSYLAWSAVPFAAGLGVMFVPHGKFYPVIWLGAGLMIAAAVMFIFAFIMPARSLKGVEQHDYLLGLKDYIKLAEADRLKFGQSVGGAEKSPAAKIKLFESLLPYAMLFGLEKSWAKQFQDLYAKPPDWYRGTNFQGALIASSLGDFSKAASTNFSAPSSSGSSGFSGGAGGGGGGGGGGGWLAVKRFSLQL
ncbi:DUF2207 domain-containing protein [Candidatus Saccharibacteria bacterium]|nr:DUF2207 domain-containing protein [Candidatus Saccharibacteria bacterium]